MFVLTVLHDGDWNMIYDICWQQVFGKTKTIRIPFRKLVVSVLMASVLMVDGVCPRSGALLILLVVVGVLVALVGVCP